MAVFTYECPRCTRRAQYSERKKRLHCADCLVEEVQIVELLLVEVKDEPVQP